MEIIKITGMMVGENVSPIYKCTTCGISSINIECPCKSKLSEQEEKTYTNEKGETMRYKTVSLSDKYGLLSFNTRLNNFNDFKNSTK